MSAMDTGVEGKAVMSDFTPMLKINPLITKQFITGDTKIRIQGDDNLELEM